MVDKLGKRRRALGERQAPELNGRQINPGNSHPPGAFRENRFHLIMTGPPVATLVGVGRELP